MASIEEQRKGTRKGVELSRRSFVRALAGSSLFLLYPGLISLSGGKNTVAAAASSEQTVGLFLNSAEAWEGYTLLAPKHYTATYLINNRGRVVHSWTAGKYEPGQSAYLLEDGHLIRACMTKGPLSTGGGEGGRLEEYDWEGKLVWEFDYSTDRYMSHHDFRPLPNGHILLLAVEKKTYDEALAAGFDPNRLSPDTKSKGYMLPDSVVEVKPTRPTGGTVVWEWHVWDHLIQDYSRSKANYGDVSAHPELVDPSGTNRHIPQFWNHMNSISYNPTLDQIMLSVRGNSEVWIIDHSTTTAEAASHTGCRSGKGGDLLYRWGNPAQYRAGTASDQKLFQQHDAEWIDTNCPGAGNILVFNNGLGRNYSSVDEFTPPIDAKGNYLLTTGTAFGPKNLSWTYVANPPNSLYSDAISGSQRLPNGNTLICDGIHGVLLEVTSNGKAVWKYVNPVVKTGPLIQGDSIPSDPARPGEFMNAVFRADRYSQEYAGLKGRNLTPGDAIELYEGLAQTGTAAFTTSTMRTSEISTIQRTVAVIMTNTDTLAASTTVSAAPADFGFLPESIVVGLGAAAVGLYLIERRRRKKSSA